MIIGVLIGEVSALSRSPRLGLFVFCGVCRGVDLASGEGSHVLAAFGVLGGTGVVDIIGVVETVG